MANIIVDAKRHTIVITKKFEKATRKFGSDEYKMLREAKADNPTFKIEVKAKKQKKETYKGLTYAYMEMYIEKHDNEQKSIMAEYKLMRGQTKEGQDALAYSFSYIEMKDWFLETFPEIAEFHKKREEIMERVQKSKEERAKAA